MHGEHLVADVGRVRDRAPVVEVALRRPALDVVRGQRQRRARLTSPLLLRYNMFSGGASRNSLGPLISRRLSPGLRRAFRIIIAPQRSDCVAGQRGLELRNVDANYPFERSHRFPLIEPNSGFGDYSRLSCSGGDTQLGAGFCRNLQQRSAPTLAIMRRRREGTNWPRSLSIRR